MREQQDWFALAGAAQARDHVLILVAGPEDLDVRGRETGGEQAPSDRLGGGRSIAVFVGGIDADQLGEDVAGKLLVWGQGGPERPDLGLGREAEGYIKE